MNEISIQIIFLREGKIKPFKAWMLFRELFVSPDTVAPTEMSELRSLWICSSLRALFLPQIEEPMIKR